MSVQRGEEKAGGERSVSIWTSRMRKFVEGWLNPSGTISSCNVTSSTGASTWSYIKLETIRPTVSDVAQKQEKAELAAFDASEAKRRPIRSIVAQPRSRLSHLRFLSYSPDIIN